MEYNMDTSPVITVLLVLRNNLGSLIKLIVHVVRLWGETLHIVSWKQTSKASLTTKTTT